MVRVDVRTVRCACNVLKTDAQLAEVVPRKMYAYECPLRIKLLCTKNSTHTLASQQSTTRDAIRIVLVETETKKDGKIRN